jgi:hypothetical protein
LVWPKDDLTGPSLVGYGEYKVDGDELTLCLRWREGEEPTESTGPDRFPYCVCYLKRLKRAD